VRRFGQPLISGTGRILDLNGSGLLFRSESRLLAGDSILAALEQPVPSAGAAPQFLLLTGYVVQVRGLCAAIAISHNDLLPLAEIQKSFDLFCGTSMAPASVASPASPSVSICPDPDTDSSGSLPARFGAYVCRI
jgi:hypothetical protein